MLCYEMCLTLSGSSGFDQKNTAVGDVAPAAPCAQFTRPVGSIGVQECDHSNDLHKTRAAHFVGQRPKYHELPFSAKIFLLMETHSLSGKLLRHTQINESKKYT